MQVHLSSSIGAAGSALAIQVERGALYRPGQAGDRQYGQRADERPGAGCRLSLLSRRCGSSLRAEGDSLADFLMRHPAVMLFNDCFGGKLSGVPSSMLLKINKVKKITISIAPAQTINPVNQLHTPDIL